MSATAWYTRDASAYDRPNTSPALIKKLHLPRESDRAKALCSGRVILCSDGDPDGQHYEWVDPPEDLKCRRCLRVRVGIDQEDSNQP